MHSHALFERVLALLFPPRCVFCDALVEYGSDTCGACLPARCGPLLSDGRENPFAGAAVPFVYGGCVRDALLRLKKGPERDVAAYFAREMLHAHTAAYPDAQPDFVVPVPQNAKKLKRQKGHDHALVLAKEVSARMKLPLRTDLLARTEDSREQHMLDAPARRENARRSFCVAAGARLNGEKVLLVDNIIATGSTAAACAALLKKAGAARIFLLVAAGA